MKPRVCLAAVVAAVLLMWCGQSAAQIRIAHALPASDGINLALLHMKQKAELDTKGRIRLEVIPGGEAGGDLSLLDQVRSGLLPMAAVGVGTLSQFDPDLLTLRLPFRFNGRTELYRFLDSPVCGQVEAGLSRLGLVPLGWFDVGARMWLSAEKSLAGPGDFRELRFNGPDDVLFLEGAKILGYVPSSIPAEGNELYKLFADKRIDAADVLPHQIALGNAAVPQSYQLVLSHHVYELVVLVTSVAYWNTVPTQDKSVLQTAVDEAEIVNRGYALSQETGLLLKAQAKGLRVVRLDDASRQVFVNAYQPLYETVRRAVGGELFDACVIRTPEEKKPENVPVPPAAAPMQQPLIAPAPPAVTPPVTPVPPATPVSPAKP